MARTAVTVNVLSPNTANAAPTATNVDVTNDHKVSGVPLEELFIVVTNTAVTSKTVTFVAGDNPPAAEAVALEVTAETDTPIWVGPFTSARFTQAGADSGQLHIDIPSGMTGTVTAVHIPRTA